MKRIIAILLCILMFFNVNIVFAAMSGAGTEKDPYVIKTADDFNSIRNNPSAYYRLEADIVLDELYTPFSFGGVLIGANEETPYSITVNTEGRSSYTSPKGGLFTFLKSNSAIKNICLKGSVSGEAYVGGLFGRSENGAENILIENCINESTVSAKGNYAGGICAVADKGVIVKNTVNKGEIYANNSAGGIAGSLSNASNCSNSGYVYCENNYAGGIAGNIAGEIVNSVNSGEISSASYCGGIAGVVSEKSVIESCANTGVVDGRGNASVCGSGGIAGGIKRLANVSCEIKNCINYGTVVNGQNFIYPSYIEYDNTNFISAENTFYLSEIAKDDGKNGTDFFKASESETLLSKVKGFTKNGNYVIPENTKYFDYVKKEVKEEIPEEVKPEELCEEAGVLKALGILDDNFKADEILTRGKFADLLIRAFYGYEALAGSGSNSFSDVTEGYEYYDAVIAVKNLGIMYAGGYNNFYPEREITGNEAVTAIIRALSYESYALSLGEYPTGYLLAGKYLKITDNVSDFNSGLTGNKAAVLLYNALTSETLSAEYKDSGTVVYEKNNGVTILNDIFNTKKYDAVLINDGIISFDGSGMANDDNEVVVSLLPGGEKIRVKADEEIKSYLGRRLNVYVKDDGASEKEVIYYSVNEKSNVTTISGEYITALKENYISYETEEKDKEYKIYFENGKYPSVLINGNISTNYKFSDLSSESAVINFIDNDGNNKADYIIINDYYCEAVAGTVNIEEKTVYAMDGTYTNLRLGKDNIVLRYAMESEIKDFSEIMKGDVILAAQSKNKIDGKDIVILNISRKILTGSVEATGNNSIFVNEEEYLLSSHVLKSDSKYMSKITVGADVTLYLNALGRVAYIEAAKVLEKNYAFILNAGFDGSFDPVANVRLINSQGDIAVFSLSDKLTEGHEKKKVANLNNFVSKLLENDDSLVVYSLNPEGEIINITFAEPASENYVENKGRFTLQKHLVSGDIYTGMTIGGICADTTVTFVIPSNFKKDGSDSKVASKYFVRTYSYSNVKFYDVGADGTATVALHMPASATGSYSTTPEEMRMFVRKTEGISPSGELLSKIYFMKNGIEQSVFVSNELELISMNGVELNSLNQLDAGDIFLFETDYSGMIKKISLVYDCNSFGTSSNGLCYIGGEGVGNNKSATIFEGMVQYVSESALTLRLPSSSYAVEKFTGVSGAYVYKVDRAKNLVKSGSFSELNSTDFALGTTGDKILVTANRNKLIEVIIYE